ncbi:LOW QUALITY PROTEIN: copine-8-like [Hydra vulgaris]|uniref:LOW QUALITY PROTEIN: copine-8-like n=1 Tax=Hydra vulgaris TaxID=6087 RepID=A0ABM4DQ44_HYDVU
MNYASQKLISKVVIHVSCANLPNKDLFSKSDPFVVLFLETRQACGVKSWVECGRTEIVNNNLNPEFFTPFTLDYNFEEYQLLKFEVYDSDSLSKTLGSHDFLGMLQVSLGSIVGEYKGNVTKQLLLRNGSLLKSTITFFVEQLNDCKEIIEFMFCGHNLDKKDFFGLSDPFLIFYKQSIDGNSSYTSIHKTDVVYKTLNPVWKEFNISVFTLCNNDYHLPILVKCFDWNKNGTQDFIGETQITLDEILNKNKTVFELINPKKKKKKNSGILEVLKANLKKIHSFLDYIVGGLELCFYVAIDFTASNGDPSYPNSLHYRHPQLLNQYAQVLTSVGRICENYDSDKLIPAYGFGARINNQVYHSFFLNKSSSPFCYGINGVLDAYYSVLQDVELYGPTNFTPVINCVAQFAASQPASEKYHVLLIITDGIISDMNQTKEAIINASKLPMSIIIVGVGNADFDAMNELDCDNSKLSFNGKIAEQDIVQFVPFHKFSGEFSGEKLSSEVLKELPGQLVNFMARKGITPNPHKASAPFQESVASQCVQSPSNLPYPHIPLS